MSELLRGVLTPERRARLDALLDSALDLSPGERAALVNATRSDDPELYAELARLLEAHDRAERGFLAGTAVMPRKNRIRPQRLGDYIVIDELGRGGMGIVYLAERDRHDGRERVAIKVLRDELYGSRLHRRFDVERLVLAAISHPNIARLLEAGQDERGRPFLVMEFIDGEPITVYCDTRQLPVDDRLRLFCSVLSAVQHAHDIHIVHRDLKPSNILVTPDGVPKLLDFGIAKLLDPSLAEDQVPITRSGVRLMTPDYASPEQVRGEAITPATDIYSLGVVLCELLTGRRPFPSVSRVPLERERMVLEVEPPAPSSLVSVAAERESQDTPIALELRACVRDLSPAGLRRRLRGDLDRIVLTALRKEPDRRYRSAAQMAEAIVNSAPRSHAPSRVGGRAAPRR